MKRRDFLKKSVSLAALSPVLSGCETTDDDNDGGAGGGPTQPVSKVPLPTYEYTGALGPETLFLHGVASVG